MSQVFVLGGTGAVGRHAVDALLAAGHDVSAVARSDARAVELADKGATPVRVSMFDAEALAAVFVGHDAVINLATAIPSTNTFMFKRSWRANDRIRTEGSAAVAQAALAAEVPRLVQESVVMLYADQGASWISEDAPVDRYPISLGNHAAEASAARFAREGGAGVVLRFGWFSGVGAAHSEAFLRLARRGLVVQMGDADTFVSSIDVADGGAAVVASLQAVPGVYNVVDDEPLTKRAFADALEDAGGSRAWVRAPGRLASVLGDKTTSLTRSVRASNEKFRSATGWAPRYRSARESLQALAAADT